MANDNSASIVTLVQPAKRPLTAAERARNYRLRQKEAKVAKTPPVTAPSRPANVRVTRRVTSLAQILLVMAAFALAAVGVTMNGWFARSLGASDVSGWLFLAIGVVADAVALAVPAVAAHAWHARQHATALAGWAVWAITFTFAVTAGIGFASTNIADVTLARAGRVTPTVTEARLALGDAMAARDRECKGGVGRFCREREAAVTDRHAALDAATKVVAQTGDPQAEAAIHVVAWLSGGLLKPSGDDFAMLRLVLLAILPQIGGILLMIGRRR